MAHLTKDKTEVNARIVFWGIPGAGVSTNLGVIHSKLRSDHRGDLKRVPTALDPTTHYEVLPIELGQVNGLRTQLEVVGLPSGAEHVPTRKQLLDHVDGVVLIIDSQPSLLEENVRFAAELRESLGAYGRTLEDLPVVVQYNKRDQSDPYTIEELHRRLAIPGAAVFEAVAPQGSGVLQTLTTISKRVIRGLRESEIEPAPPPPTEPVAQAPVAEPQRAQTIEPKRIEPKPGAVASVVAEVMGVAEPDAAAEPIVEATFDASKTLELEVYEDEEPAAPADLMEQAILAEGNGEDDDVDAAALAAERGLSPSLENAWDAVSEEMKSADGARIGPDFEIVSVGSASRHGQRAVRIPLVLGNPDGETVTLALTVALDPLVDGDEEQ